MINPVVAGGDEIESGSVRSIQTGMNLSGAMTRFPEREHELEKGKIVTE